jgi:hypothetical protein
MRYGLTKTAPSRHADQVSSDPNLNDPPRTRQEIVYLDPTWERPVSPYSPEGEIRMMGDFAAGLSRRSNISRPMAIALVAIILFPIVLSLLAVLTSW